MKRSPFIQAADAEGIVGGVHRLFEAQAARTPDACAVDAGVGACLTYRELDARANVLAERVRALGAGPNVPVGICVGRSPESIVAILAVLKSGGAYVPLAPEYPDERLAYMLENARASVLIADPKVWAQPVPAGVTLISPHHTAASALNPRSPSLNPSSSFPPPRTHNPQRSSLAYIIYTSGSTGQPKGVAMEHAALLNLLAWQQRTLPLAPGDRVLQFAPLSFDVSFQEIFSTLAAGGTLLLVSDALRIDPRGLLRLMTEREVGRVFLPPVMLYQLAEQSMHGDFLPQSLREVIVAGEALRITPATARFFSRLPNCGLHNHYGPTETHVTTAWTLEGPAAEWPELPPIGRPIDGVEVRVLDEDGHCVPDGAPGALFLGGACVARGYLHNPEMTAERFVELEGGRFYRTGDLVKRGPDGVLQFLGRADDQVKIRGFRVELGEVEAALSHHPDIRETAVGVTSGDNRTAQELVGYYVLRPGSHAPAAADLRRWLIQRLPDYLVPTHFAALAALPLTPSGKVDRRNLPRHQAARAESRPAAGAVPASPLEKAIARVWEETLEIKSPGVRDNFFEVGGNSLHAVKVHTRLVETLQREFPIVALFEHPTIAALARYLNPEPAPTNPTMSNPARERAARQQAANAAAANRARLALR